MTDPSGIKSYRSGIRGALDRMFASKLEFILSIPGAKLYKKFEADTKRVQAVQEGVLSEILSYAGDTVFGREHGFAKIDGPAAFGDSVPIGDYEYHRPYVDRHTKGEENVLFPGKPLMYNRSSGTTTLPKLIPVTPYNFQKTIKDRSKLWLYGLMRHYPGIYRSKSFSMVSPAVEGYTEDGTPFGSLSGVMRENIPEFMKLTHSTPYSVTLIKDHPSKVYTALRFALACDVSVILTGNPATMLNMAVKADEWKEELIRDIRDGTLKPDLSLEPEIRAEAESMFSPAPGRAAELDRLASTNEKLRPAEYWPNLGLIHTWTNGNTGLVIPKLKPWFRPDTPTMDFGYISSEILSADLIEPKTNGSILQVQSGYYEFSRFEDEYAEDREFLLAHQLEVGKKYYIYVTTFSGLYRYDMNDVIEVIGHFNEAPIIRFLFKGKGITNLQGEKLSEAQLIEAVRRAAATTGIDHEFFIGFADVEESRYKLHIEFLGEPPPEAIVGFGEAVDRALSEVNVEYATKRTSERLEPLTVVPMGKDFFARYRALRLEEGAHEGQIKWLHLAATDVTKQRLAKLV